MHMMSGAGQGVRGNEDGEEEADVVHLHMDTRICGSGAVRGSSSVSRLAIFFLFFFVAL